MINEEARHFATINEDEVVEKEAHKEADEFQKDAVALEATESVEEPSDNEDPDSDFEFLMEQLNTEDNHEDNDSSKEVQGQREKVVERNKQRSA